MNPYRQAPPVTVARRVGWLHGSPWGALAFGFIILLSAGDSACTASTHDAAVRSINTTGTILDAAEPALAASERAAQAAIIAAAPTREEAAAKLLVLHNAYHRAWLAYSAARDAEVLAMAAARAEEQGVAKAGDAEAAVAAMAAAEADFMAAVRALKEAK